MTESRGARGAAERSIAAGSLVGRDPLIAHVARLVDDGARLVTLRGTVGVGKARLAAEIAERLVVDGTVRATSRAVLRELDTASDVDRAIDLALRERRRPACLVLEGCEPGRDAVVHWLETRWPREPSLLVIATSRTRLGLTHEHVVPVDALDEDDAVELLEALIAAARGARETVAPVVEDDARALVQRIGATPLVLELAAAQAHVLSIGDLLARRNLLLDLLGSPHPRPRPHEATLRDAIESAWRPLDAPARRVLAICAQFEGPFLLTDVETLAGRARPPVARQLARLADASLVTVARAGREPWLMLPIAARLLARESASTEHEGLREEWTMHVLRAVRPIAEGAHVAHAASAVARFREDLIAIADRPDLVALDPEELATRTLALLARSRGPVDQTIAALDRACERNTHGPPGLRARLLHLRGVLFGRAGAAARAGVDLDAATALASSLGEHSLLARIATDHGDILRHAGDDRSARTAYERAVNASRGPAPKGGRSSAVRDATNLTLALGALASMAHERGELDECARRHRELEAIARSQRRSIEDAAIAIVHHSRGTLLVETGDHEGAERAFREALAAHRTSGNRRFEGIAEHDLGCLALERRQVATARAHLGRAERLAREVGDRRELGLCHALLGVCEALIGDPSAAQAWLASAETLVHHTAEPALIAAFETHRAHLVALELRRRRQRGETLPTVLLDELRGALDAAESRANAGDEVRLAHRVLAAEAARVLRAGTIVAPDGTWFFTPHTGRVSLARKGILSRLLAALVGAHRALPPAALSPEALARAGWPATRALTPTAKNRLHVAVTSIRKLGLGDSLVYAADGYRLMDVEIGERV